VPVSSPESPSPAFTVLLVCTGNICRSALAERLGRAFLDEMLGDDAAAIRLVSAGTRAVVDAPMHPDSGLVLGGLGGDAGGHRARQLTDGMATAAELTLTMTRSHQRAVLGLAPRALARTFTLREAADLVRILGDGVHPAGETFAERARALVGHLAAARARRSGGEDDDIRDPMGLPVDVHQEVGEAIAESLLPVLTRLGHLARPTSDHTYGASPAG
jgi:protein-tyrosine phosphatase